MVHVRAFSKQKLIRNISRWQRSQQQTILAAAVLAVISGSQYLFFGCAAFGRQHWKDARRLHYAQATREPFSDAHAANVDPACRNLLSVVSEMLVSECKISSDARVPLLVSVSGGLDSVALLLLVSRIAERHPWDLHVLHFNHGLRPEAADEETFVKALATARGWNCHVRRATQPEAFKKASCGLQAAARQWRRQESELLLKDLELQSAAQHGAVLLAHHLDDQVETQLLKLLRGSHIARLRGMLPRDGCFARPLLRSTKSDLQAFLSAEGQTWMEDSSNMLPVYQRNKVRLQLVPIMAEIAGGVDALHNRFSHLKEQSSQLAEMLDTACEQHGGPAFPEPQELAATTLNIGVDFQKLPLMVRHEIVWRFVVNACDIKLSYSAVRGMVSSLAQSDLSASWSWPLGSDWELQLRDTQLMIFRIESQKDHTWRADDLVVRQDGSQAAIKGLRVQRLFSKGTDSGDKGKLNSFGAADVPKTNELQSFILHGIPSGSILSLRGATKGDRFCAGLCLKAHSIKLTQFLHRSMSVPPGGRLGWPVLTLQKERRSETQQLAEPQINKQETVVAVLPDIVAGDFSQASLAESVPPVLVEFVWKKA